MSGPAAPPPPHPRQRHQIGVNCSPAASRRVVPARASRGQPTKTPSVVGVPNGSSEADAGSAAPDRFRPRYTLTRLGWPAPLPTARSALVSPSALTVASDTSAAGLSPLTVKLASGVAPNPGDFPAIRSAPL